MKKFIKYCSAVLISLSFIPTLLLFGVGSIIRLLGNNKISDVLEYPMILLAGEFLIASSEVVESQEPVLPRVFTTNEIIDYVVNYYKTNPRAVSSSGVCKYLTYKGYRCGHSICLDDGIDCSKWYFGASSAIRKFGDKIHKPEFRGNERQFWQEIQSLHDNNLHWVPNSVGGSDLSKEGESFVQRMKSTNYKQDEISSL